MTTNACLAVRALGPFDVVVDGRALELTRQERTLLAMLAVSVDRVVAVDTLVDALWPDFPPMSARNRLHVLVSGLRRRLRAADSRLSPAKVVLTRPTGYVLAGEWVELDRDRFDNLIRQGRARIAEGRNEEGSALLREALGLWRGPAFGGVTGATIEAEAIGLEEIRLATVEATIDAELAVGRHAELVPELSRLCAGHPLRERLHGQLMVALDRCGRQADALGEYRALQTRLREELGIEPGHALQDVHRELLRERPAHPGRASQTDRDDLERPPAAVQLPRQLPRRLPELVGRDQETALLRRVLGPARARTPGVPPVAGVYGPGGVGKTALAVHVAWTLGPAYPDGCLFADLHGGEPAPEDPFRLLGSFLRALGLAAGAIPHELADRAATFRTLLADRRVLVVLDNAASADQVRGLLPGGSGCGVLVTSRRPLTSVYGGEAIALAALAQADARRLLLQLAGPRHADADPVTLDTLAGLCGRLPIALRVAGARLAARADLSAAALVGRLGDERRRLDELAIDDLEVRATLAESYRRLDPQARFALRLLSLAPSPEVDLRLAAAMLDVPVAAAEPLLSRLVEEQLAQARTGEFDATPRYWLHDLVRLFGRELDDADDLWSAALDRGYAHLLGLAVTADTHLATAEFPSSPDHEAALPGAELAGRISEDPIGWFEMERPTLAGFVAHAAQLGHASAAWSITSAMVNFLEQQTHIDDWQYLVDLSLDATQRASDSHGLAAMMHAKAFLLRGFGQHDEAYRLLRGARLRYRLAGDALASTVAAMHLGMCARRLGHRRVALVALHKAVADFARLDDPPQTGYAHISLGNLWLETGDLSAGAAEYKAALARFEAIGQRRGEANALAGMASAHRRAGALEDALVCCERAVAIFTDLGDAANIAEAEIILAELHLSTGDAVAARVVAERALATCQQLRYRSGETRARRTLGLALLSMGDAAAAQALLRQAVGQLRSPSQPLQLGLTLFALARSEHALRDTVAAARSADEARRLLASVASPVVAEVDEWLAATLTGPA